MKRSEYREIIEVDEQMPHFREFAVTENTDRLVYQYRNFDSFWKILESDAFWATNARFCNDDAEQHFGADVIESIGQIKCSTERPNKIETDGLDENYIVCFCLENDKLSQWRGYAPEGGASIGYDFENMPRPFAIQKNMKVAASGKDEYTEQYVELDAVKYLSPKGRQDEEVYREKCREELKLINASAFDDEAEAYRGEIKKKAPYIKHSGFWEENELRLVFRNLNESLNECIRYRSSGRDALQYPYIIVRPALAKTPSQCAVRVCADSTLERELVEKLENTLKGSGNTHVNGCHWKKGDTPGLKEAFCRGCVLRRFEEESAWQKCRFQNTLAGEVRNFYLDENTNCVVISQGKNQKKIFELVHEQVQKYTEEQRIKAKIPVWCEGHLPIRKITVGPCPDQKEMVESIRHYCRHTYWLKDVEIEESTIPFRKAL